MKVILPNIFEYDRPSEIKSLRIIRIEFLLLPGVVVRGISPIGFAMAAYVAAVPASKVVLLGDSAATCSVTQLFFEVNLTQATVSAATVALGICSATRCCSEPVIVRPTVED